MRRIAIIGMGNSEGDAPWRDPTWECWTLAWHPFCWHVQRLFEMHPMEIVLRVRSNYWERLAEIGDIPLYLQRKHPDLPSSLDYPLEEVSGLVGDYYGSSPAYMLALAIYENVDHIGIWGVDLKESIYDHQRPNLEYLIGFARGRGISVEIHPDSKLLTLKRDDHIAGTVVYYPERYGWVA